MDDDAKHTDTSIEGPCDDSRLRHRVDAGEDPPHTSQHASAGVDVAEQVPDDEDSEVAWHQKNMKLAADGKIDVDAMWKDTKKWVDHLRSKMPDTHSFLLELQIGIEELKKWYDGVTQSHELTTRLRKRIHVLFKHMECHEKSLFAQGPHQSPLLSLALATVESVVGTSQQPHTKKAAAAMAVVATARRTPAAAAKEQPPRTQKAVRAADKEFRRAQKKLLGLGLQMIPDGKGGLVLTPVCPSGSRVADMKVLASVFAEWRVGPTDMRMFKHHGHASHGSEIVD